MTALGGPGSTSTLACTSSRWPRSPALIPTTSPGDSRGPPGCHSNHGAQVFVIFLWGRVGFRRQLWSSLVKLDHLARRRTLGTRISLPVHFDAASNRVE